MANATKQLRHENDQLKAELETMKASFQNFMESSSDSVLVIDQEHRIRFANLSAGLLFGCSPEALNKITFDYPVSLGEVKELVIPLADGRRINVEMHAAKAAWDGDAAFVVSLRDVTDRKQVEERLRESRARYKSLYSMVRLMCDTVPDLIWAKDIEGHFLFTNKAVCEKLLGAKDTDEPIGKNDMFFAQRERNSRPENPKYHTFGEECIDSDQVVIATRKPERFEEYGNVKGEFLFLDVHKAPLWDEHGNMIGTVGSARVATKEKEMERDRELALARHQQSEKALTTILESVPFGILIIDKDKIVRRANRGALEVMGYESEAEIVGRSCQSGLCVPENGTCPMQEGERKFITVEKLISTKSGDTIPVLKSAVWVTINDEDVWLEAFVDISKRKHAENELNAYHNWLDALLRTIPNPVFAKDREGRYTLVNKAFEAFFGCTAERLIGKTVYDCWATEQARALHQKDIEMMENPEIQQYEYKVVLENGKEKCIIYKKACIYKPDGQVTGIVGTITDVSEIKQAQEKIRMLSIAVEQSANVIIITDYNGDIEYVNPKFTKITGYEFEEIVGKNPRFLKSDHHPDAYYKHLWDTIKSGQVWAGEFHNRKKNGAAYWEQATISPIKDNEGQIVQFLAVKEDITERKQAEDARDLSEKNLSAILESISAAVLSVDEMSTIIRANRAAEKIFGYPIEEITGKPFELLISQNFLKEHPQTVQELFSKNPDLTVASKIQGRKQDGSEFSAEVTVSRMAVADKLLLIVMLTDITQREKMQAQLLRNQRMESIGLLASGIAHDMNNILTPILSGVDFLSPHIQNPSALKYLDLMEKSARRAADLIRQLLTFARGHDGQKAVVELGHLIGELKRFVRQTFPRTIMLEVNLQKAMFPVSIDPTQMHQVLINLLVNARDAMPSGGLLKIQGENFVADKSYAGMHPDAKEGTYVLITITDTGMGIHPELLPKIFEPFFTTKQPGHGTGLGLATVHSIIYNHGGFIRVASQVGLGTSFKLFLPAAFNEKNERRQVSAGGVCKGNGEMILVVDDEDAIREITGDILIANGYRVISASNGTQALAAFAQHKNEVKAVILDMMMPIMDGPATIYALRKINPSIKAIAVSGLMDADAIAKKTGDAIAIVLTKPYTAQNILDALYQLIHQDG
ncbi:MAG: PAS domain S-box protein [Chlorobiales bacterium]|nr:PAS domain S-box protein [Chlorobiales bacterium]